MLKRIGVFFMSLILASITALALAETNTYQVTLSGSEEVPPVSTGTTGHAIFRIMGMGNGLSDTEKNNRSDFMSLLGLRNGGVSNNTQVSTPTNQNYGATGLGADISVNLTENADASTSSNAAATSSEVNMEFDLFVENGNGITAAHLHCGRVGENGPVIVQLFGEVPGGVTVDGRLVRSMLGDESIVAAATCSPSIASMKDLVNAVSAGAVYVNVHSADHPNGLIRAQLITTQEGTAMGTSSSTVGTTLLDDLLERLRLLVEQIRAEINALR